MSNAYPAIAEAQARIREAEEKCRQGLYAQMYQVTSTQCLPVKTVPLRVRLGWWWYGVREWVAIHILRIVVEREDG